MTDRSWLDRPPGFWECVLYRAAVDLACFGLGMLAARYFVP